MPTNQLLDHLPAAELRRLWGVGVQVPLQGSQPLLTPDLPVCALLFPLKGFVCLVTRLDHHPPLQVAMVGCEGVVGVALFMGGETTPSRAVVQSAGGCFRLRAAVIKAEFNRYGVGMHLLLRYTQALLTQMAQTAVCNRHHLLEQQLCRWLLLSLDRIAGDELVMTQELIANMLGVRREGVTEAALKLQKLGLIDYSRGHITVLDRAALEQRSCECYEVVKREYDRLLKPPVGRPR